MKAGDTVIINTLLGSRYFKYNGEEATVIAVVEYKGDMVITAHNDNAGYITMKAGGFKEIPMTLTQFIKLKSFLVKNDNDLPPGSEFLAVVPVNQLQHYFPQLVAAHVNP